MTHSRLDLNKCGLLATIANGKNTVRGTRSRLCEACTWAHVSNTGAEVASLRLRPRQVRAATTKSTEKRQLLP